MFWAVTSFVGFASGPTYSMAMSFVNHYICMTPTNFALLDVGIAIGSLVSYLATGHLLQNHEPKQLFFFCLSCTVAAVVILVCMQVLGRARVKEIRRQLEEGDKYKGEQTSASKDATQFNN